MKTEARNSSATETRNSKPGTRNSSATRNSKLGTRNLSAFLVMLLASAAATRAVDVVQNDSAPVVLERGPHHKIVQSASGGVYTELANGMHFIKDGQFVESQETIFIDANGYGVADQGLHQARFAPSITDVPAVIYTDPD